MPAANYQLFVVDLRLITQNNAALAIVGFFNSIDARYGDQRTAMNAYEVVAKFLNERSQ